MIYYQRTDPDGRPPVAVPMTAALVVAAVFIWLSGGVVGWFVGYANGAAREAELAGLLDRCATVSERSHAAVWGADWAILDTLDMLGLPDPADGLPVADDGSGG